MRLFFNNDTLPSVAGGAAGTERTPARADAARATRGPRLNRSGKRAGDGYSQTDTGPFAIPAAWRNGQNAFRASLWSEITPEQRGHLEALGIDEQGFHAVRSENLNALPEAVRTPWQQLTAEQQRHASELGFAADTWDAAIAWRHDIGKKPKLWQAFRELAAEGQIDANAFRTLARKSRSVLGLFRTDAGKRALLYLRAFHKNAFTPDGVRALTDEVNKAALSSMTSLGWISSVTPRRTVREAARVAAGGSAIVNDASGLSAAVVRGLVSVKSEEELLFQVAKARFFGWPINIAGARHSEGGQTCVDGSLNLDLTQLKSRRLVDGNDAMWVGPGNTWSDIIRDLTAQNTGKTVRVMQASSIFHVGGSLSVNCHGRTPNDGPLISTIDALRVLTLSGEIVMCSRTERSELFRSVIGGYGMFGIILEAKLKLAEDVPVKVESVPITIAELPSRFAAMVRDPTLRIGYARIEPSARDASGGAALNIGREISSEEAAAFPTGADFEVRSSGLQTWIEQAIYRISNYARPFMRLRWKIEERMRSQPSVGPLHKYLDLGADGLTQFPWREGKSTDILEEVFLPFNAYATGEAAAERDARFLSFLQDMYELQTKHDWRTGNCTVRSVRADTESAIPYAPVDSAAFVLYYPRRNFGNDELRSRAFVDELYDLIIRHGGRFYMPYRQDHKPSLTRRSYPELAGASRVLALRQTMDPDGQLNSALPRHLAGDRGI